MKKDMSYGEESLSKNKKMLEELGKESHKGLKAIPEIK